MHFYFFCIKNIARQIINPFFVEMLSIFSVTLKLGQPLKRLARLIWVINWICKYSI